MKYENKIYKISLYTVLYTNQEEIVEISPTAFLLYLSVPQDKD